jgi:hypothetical protein
MSEFREATTPEDADTLRALLPPPEREIGQKVFWAADDATGSTVFEGRITRIEIGRYGYSDNSATRKYVAVADRACHMDYRGNATWREKGEFPRNQEWMIDYYSGLSGDWWSRLFLTLDKALEKAAEKRDWWAAGAERDAKDRRRDAATWRSMKTQQEDVVA